MPNVTYQEFLETGNPRTLKYKVIKEFTRDNTCGTGTKQMKERDALQKMVISLAEEIDRLNAEVAYLKRIDL